MAIYNIPLTNIPQKFTIELGGKEYILTCRWNDAIEGGWFIDIDDSITNTPILHNLPLVTGNNLLEQYEYLGIKGALVVLTNGDNTAVPTLENLGVESFLYFVTTDDSQ
jgi:hypothetical protein